MAEFPGSFSGPVGPTGGSTYDSSFENSIVLLSNYLASAAVGVSDFYLDAFQSSEGIDANSVCDFDSTDSCVLVPISSPSSQFDFDFSSLQRWNTCDARGSIQYWVLDESASGHFEGENKYLFGPAVDRGSGKVGLPCSNHGLTTNQNISVFGTSGYDGIYTIDADTSTNQIVISVSYAVETFSSAFVRQRVRVGSGGDNTSVEAGVSVDFGSSSLVIAGVAGDGSGVSGVTLEADHVSDTVITITNLTIGNNGLRPTYYLSPYIGTWSTISPSISPTSRNGSRLVFDPVGKQALLFGGMDATGIKNDLWKFDVTQDTWTALSPASPPSARCWHSLVLDSVNRTLLLFGGTHDSLTALNDLWKYDIAQGTWTQLSPTGGPPAVRVNHAACYNSVDQVMLISFGWDFSTLYSDVWVYSVASNVWTNPTYSGGTRAARVGGSMIFEPNTSLSYYFGGLSSGPTFYDNVYWFSTDATGSNYGWEYSLTAGTQGRVYQSMILDPLSKSFISYGGSLGSQVIDLLEYGLIESQVIRYESGSGIRQDHSACFDTENWRMLCFGGLDEMGDRIENSISVFKKNQYARQRSLVVAYTDDSNHMLLKHISAINSVSIDNIISFYGPMYFAVSFDSRMTWKVQKNRVWRDVVQYSGGSWQYKDGSDAWHNAFDLQTALETAMAISQNQWSTDTTLKPADNSSTTKATPTMTSNTAPSPYITSASSEYSATYYAWKAFDGGTTNYWSTLINQVANSWVKIDMGSSGAFVSNKWRWRSDTNTYNPKRFKLQGSNDNSNWTDLHSDYASVDYTQIASGAYTEWFYFENYTAYRYYRMFIISGYSTSYVYVDEIEIIAASGFTLPGPECVPSPYWVLSGGFVPGTSTALDIAVGFQSGIDGVPSISKFSIDYTKASSNLTFITKTWMVSNNNPSHVFCLLVIESVESLTLDTDLKVWVSMDDGVNYEQVTGLSIVKTDGDKKLIRGDKSGLTARDNNKMKMKITSHNQKFLKLLTVGCGVRYT
jgi:hypothetical protein